jgi:hypothetical protein
METNFPPEFKAECARLLSSMESGATPKSATFVPGRLLTCFGHALAERLGKTAPEGAVFGPRQIEQMLNELPDPISTPAKLELTPAPAPAKAQARNWTSTSIDALVDHVLGPGTAKTLTAAPFSFRSEAERSSRLLGALHALGLVCPAGSGFEDIWKRMGAVPRLTGFAAACVEVRQQRLNEFCATPELSTNDLTAAFVHVFGEQDLQACMDRGYCRGQPDQVRKTLIEVLEARGIRVSGVPELASLPGGKGAFARSQQKMDDFLKGGNA